MLSINELVTGGACIRHMIRVVCIEELEGSGELVQGTKPFFSVRESYICVKNEAGAVAQWQSACLTYVRH